MGLGYPGDRGPGSRAGGGRGSRSGVCGGGRDSRVSTVLSLVLAHVLISWLRFDPQLKAGSSFYATLPVPADLIEDALTKVCQEGEATPAPSVHTRKAYEHGGQRSLDNARTFVGTDVKPRRKSVTWIVEVISQTIFSATASVGFEVVIGRDEKSLSYGVLRPGTASSTDSSVNEGITFSRALKVKIQNTQDLWNIPPFPSSSDTDEEGWRLRDGEYLDPEDQDEAGERQQRKRKKRKPKKIHLVILTHGLHSNTGTDMLFMKEAIDEEARKGDIAWRERRRKEREENGKPPETSREVEEDREQVIVRGFHENVCRTELGIKYLGRRLARYVLHLVHPNTSPSPPSGPNKLHKPRPAHHHPHLAAPEFLHDLEDDEDLPPYKITSISFIGHSLGGLVQTYAIAYIHAHSPKFFSDITPINFVALATPFLGLSNENPLYVKFALDFGLVGRTGQDLGLTWRAPSAFSAFTTRPTAAAHPTDTSKPLLRILPTGPAHEVLKKFRNRTVYANVVNDGIVPLRTSCLLFLDWKGLGKVEKARRENGAVQGLVGWGWGQLTNGGSTSPRGSVYSPSMSKSTTVESSTSPVAPGFWSRAKAVESPVGGRSPLIQASDDDNPVTEAPLTGEPTDRERQASGSSLSTEPAAKTIPTPNAFASLLTLFRPHGSSKPRPLADSKSSKIYRRSQTIPLDESLTSTSPGTPPSFPQPSELEPLPLAPPRTTLLEAANHVLNPPLPSVEFIIDPSSRPRTIFHDRVYSSTDVPPSSPIPDASSKDPAIKESMKVEEKIARAYHSDLAWRKVLVRLEPDAHNNMIVRRMFANAYGWPVARHVVETHFGESISARTADADEGKEDHAASSSDDADGDVTPRPGQAGPEVDLDIKRETRNRARSLTASSGAWSDRAFAVTDDEDSDSSEEDLEARKEENIGRFLGLQPRLQRPVMSSEMRHKSSSTTAGVRVDIVVSPGSSGSGSASGDLGDGPGAVWGGEGGGLGLGDVTRIGLGRWGNTAGRPAGATLEPVKGGGSDAVRLLERNISIAGPSRSREGSASSRDRAGSVRARDGGSARGSSRTGSDGGSDIGER